MPVIRVKSQSKAFPEAEREVLIDTLANEIEGRTSGKDVVVFEIPLEGTDQYDVLVVWDDWGAKNLPGEFRSEIIQSAYLRAASPIADQIASSIGATVFEAREQGLLPFAVVPMLQKFEVPDPSMIAAMRQYGAMKLPDNRFELRLPTLAMAQQVHRSLVEELPKGYWSIVH